MRISLMTTWPPGCAAASAAFAGATAATTGSAMTTLDTRAVHPRTARFRIPIFSSLAIRCAPFWGAYKETYW